MVYANRSSFDHHVQMMTCSHISLAFIYVYKYTSMKMQSIYRRKLLFFLINKLLQQLNCNNIYYQLQMDTFCMQSVIPVTNIISFSII